MGEKTKKKDRLFFSLFIFTSKVSPLSLSLFHGWYSLSQVLDYPEKTTPVNIMNDIISVESITRHICFIRGHKVIIDRDLAELYGVLTKALKQAVHRNINRFPEDFMFELTCKEETLLRSQNVTLEGKWKHSKYLSMAFTEQGVAMLSSVLKSKRAIDVNITIMQAFVKMREMMATSKEFSEKLKIIESKLVGHDEQFKFVFDAIRPLLAEEDNPKRKIGF